MHARTDQGMTARMQAWERAHVYLAWYGQPCVRKLTELTRHCFKLLSGRYTVRLLPLQSPQVFTLISMMMSAGGVYRKVRRRMLRVEIDEEVAPPYKHAIFSAQNCFFTMGWTTQSMTLPTGCCVPSRSWILVRWRVCRCSCQASGLTHCRAQQVCHRAARIAAMQSLCLPPLSFSALLHSPNH